MRQPGLISGLVIGIWGALITFQLVWDIQTFDQGFQKLQED
jgi:hypothetical protein